MALKTNSKRVKEKIVIYILNNFTDYDGNTAEGRTFEEVGGYIAEAFASEKISYDKAKRQQRFYNMRCSLQGLFFDWCQGLPSVLDTCYYYNVSAVDLLGDILEETEKEKAKYTEQDAERLMTYLIFKALEKFIYKAL